MEIRSASLRMLLLATAGLAAACQPLVTSESVVSKDSPPVDGLVYYLPTYRYRLIVLPGDETGAAARASAMGGEFHAFAPPDRPDPYAVTELPIVAQMKLPKTQKCPAGGTIEIRGPIVLGDTSRPIKLSRTSSAFLDEELGLVISPAGIIRSTDTLTTGQLDGFIKVLSQIIFSAATGVPTKPAQGPGPAGVPARPLEKAELCMSKIMTVDFDPTKLTAPSVSLEDMQMAGLESSAAHSAEPQGPLASVDGIYYRALESKTIRVADSIGEIDNFTMDVNLLVPTGALGFVRFDGSLLADGDGTAVRFKDGVPVSYDIKSPSDALALINIPLDIINAFLQLPIDVLTFRTKEVTAQNSLSTAQLELPKTMLELKKAQDAAQAGGSSTPGGGN